MKSCPTCNRTYPDDMLAFCLMDGSVLSAPYDPNKPAEPSTRETIPARTEVLQPQSTPLPETKLARPQTNIQPTITAPFQPQPIASPAAPAYGMPAAFVSAEITAPPDIVGWMFIVRGAAAICLGLLLLLLAMAYL